MKLTQLLALLRVAADAAAVQATYAGLTVDQRTTLATDAFNRAQELSENVNRSDDETAELALCLDAAEALQALTRADTENARRLQAIAAGAAQRTANPVLAGAQARGTDPVPSQDGTQPIPLRIGNLDLHSREARAIVADLEGYGLRDSQIRTVGSEEYRDEFMRWMRSCASNPYGSYQSRALNEITVDGGGAVVPLDFVAEIIQRRAAMKRVSSMVRRFQTSRDRLSIPKTNAGSSTQINDLAVQWVGAEGSVTEDTGLQEFGNVEISIHRGGLKIVADRAWLEDAAFDMERWVVEQIADMYEAMIENIIINGSGVGRPFGLVTRTGTTTPADNLITCVNVGDPIDATGLLSIIGDLDAQYANNAEWLVRRSALFQQIISLRDSAGGFLFGTNMTTDGGAKARIENQLLGYGVTQTDFMAAAAASAKVLYFGDFRQGYGLAERVTLQIEPLVDPALQVKDQRAWYVRFRLGGDVLADWAIRCGLNTDHA